MPLTDRAIQNLKPEDKPQKHFDGRGLHLVVSPAGGKHWRYAYRFQGKQKLLSIGPYPAVSLKTAREKRDEAKGKLAEGVDPAEHKQEMKRFSADRAENSFAAVAKEWYLKYRDTWTEKHGCGIWRRLNSNILAYMGHMPIGDIKPFELLTILRRIEARGALDQAHRITQILELRRDRESFQSGLREHDAAKPGLLRNLATLGASGKSWRDGREILAREISGCDSEITKQQLLRDGCREAWLSEPAREYAKSIIASRHPEVGEACERHMARHWEKANEARLERQKERQAGRDDGNSQGRDEGLSR